MTVCVYLKIYYCRYCIQYVCILRNALYFAPYGDISLLGFEAWFQM